jgi:hypothetical protein
MPRRDKNFVEKQIKWSLPHQLAGYPIRKALSPGIIVTHPIRHRAIFIGYNGYYFGQKQNSLKPMSYKSLFYRVTHSATLVVASLIVLTACTQPGEKKDIKPAKIEKAKGIADESVFKSMDKRALLTRLFDNPVFDTGGTAIWKPNYYERTVFPVSYDGKCHTSIDTIMYFPDQNGKKCAAVILTTYNYRRSDEDSSIQIGDSHFAGVPIGIALFSPVDTGGWELYKFEKAFTSLGYFGKFKTGRQDAGQISLKQAGNQWTVLSLTQGVGGDMGLVSGTETLYSIEKYSLDGFPNEVLSKIISYDTYYEQDPGSGMPKKEQKTEMKILKTDTGYYAIDLVVTRNKAVSTTHYKYADKYNRYMEK